MDSSLFLDLRYIGLISPYLDRFSKQDETLYNFRCPLCGDSKKSKWKARGFFYKYDSMMMMKCHNCNESIPFAAFLKRFDLASYRQYTTEAYIEGGGRVSKAEDYYTDADKEESPPPTEWKTSSNLNIKCVSDLETEHFAQQYVRVRKIPKDKWYRLFYSPLFCQTIADAFPHYYDIERHKTQLRWKEARLVMPYYDRQKNLIGMQGRAFDPEAPRRYIVAKAAEDSPKIYGLDEVDPSQTVYVLEGPIDSLFLPNALATMDSALHGIDHLLGGLKLLNRVLVPDHQPRNKGVCLSIKRAIDAKENVVIWPRDIDQKDINEMITDGHLTPSEILSIIDRRTFKGLSAKFEFDRWQKINN